MVYDFTRQLERLKENRISVFAVAAVTQDLGLGLHGKLCWHIPADLDHFKKLTLGKPLLMGRKTFLSLPGKRGLRGRYNLILSSSDEFRSKIKKLSEDKVQSFMDPAYALDMAIDICVNNNISSIAVIGGGEIYELFMEVVDTIFLTKIATKINVDTYFPAFSESEWCLKYLSKFHVHEEGYQVYKFQFAEYRRLSCGHYVGLKLK